MPAELGEVIGQTQPAALSQELIESYTVEHFSGQFMHLLQAEGEGKFGGLDEAGGHFRAAACSLQVRR